jgi:hypothetical protein
MTLKRKLGSDFDDVSPVVFVSPSHHRHSFLMLSLQSTKQLKLVPFPNIELDTDVAMSEAEPLYPNIHHSRLPSGASSISSSTSDSPILGIRTDISRLSNITIHIYICALQKYIHPLTSTHFPHFQTLTTLLRLPTLLLDCCSLQAPSSTMGKV